MNIKKCRAVLGFLLGVVFALSINFGNFIIPLVAAVLAIFILRECERRSEEIIVDERIVSISEKASKRAFDIFLTSGAVLGVVFIAAGNKGIVLMKTVGYILTFSITVLVLLYIIFYEYYRRKYGG